ncbi:hypothetical protein ACO2Q3_05385 [Caulobacter sp. KR2-114]|uniref:hypothetical protein n=1 Tax=Caulobacter sp. KR2-114 TaxID=3400912 RepID=UPI003C02A0FB
MAADVLDTAPFTISEADGVRAGPVRRPANFSKNAKGSIHDDERARELGFRGGTVAGNIHFEQFPPLLEAVLGPEWRRTGGLSLYFLTPTSDAEPVQAFAGPTRPRPEGGLRADVWMETPEGVRVCEGTASVGPPDDHSALRQRLAAVRPAADLRILKGRNVGDRVAGIPSRQISEKTSPRVETITEPMDIYVDPSILGGLVAAPSAAIDALREVEGPLFRAGDGFVGMFGAIELQFLDGPVFIDRDYLCDGQILALSESPKTEIAWYESILRPADGGDPVARLILMSRLLKASSPLWT